MNRCVAYFASVKSVDKIERILSHAVAGNGVLIFKGIYWTLTLVTTGNCDSLNELQTQQITVTTEHIKSSQIGRPVCWFSR
jgi:hypothetical protein